MVKLNYPFQAPCLEVIPKATKELYIFDNVGKRSYAVLHEHEVQQGEDYLIVKINSDAQFVFIAVDGCLIKGNNRKRCDAALCWGNEVVLLDLKLNTGKERLDQTKMSTPGIKTAMSFHDQMKSTINYFVDYLKISLDHYNIRLCIVFPSATITTTMNAELLGLESDIFNDFGINVTYRLIPDTPSQGLFPLLQL